MTAIQHDDRTAQPGGRKHPVRLRAAATVGLLCLTGVFVAGLPFTARQSAAAEAAAQSQISDLTARTATSASSPTGSPVPAGDVMGSARSKANEVAALQTQFAQMLSQVSTSNNGAPGQGFLDSVEHRRLLAPHFAASTYQLTDKVAYSPSSELGLATGKIDPRLPWYQRTPGQGTYVWSTAAVSLKSSTAAVVDVTWLCRDPDTGDLFAWASATWSADAGAFTSLTVGSTTNGDAQSITTPTKTGSR